MGTWTDQEWFDRHIEQSAAEAGFGAAGLTCRGWCNHKPQFDQEVDWEQVQRIAIGEDVPETNFGNIQTNEAETAKPRRKRK